MYVNSEGLMVFRRRTLKFGTLTRLADRSKICFGTSAEIIISRVMAV